MTDKYKPEYKEDHLYVFFKEDCPTGMAEYLSKKFNYKIIPNNDFNWYIYDVGNDIESAKNNFLKYEEFVSGVEQRDLKFENRAHLSKNLESIARNLMDSVDSPEFKKHLKEMKKQINSFKE